MKPAPTPYVLGDAGLIYGQCSGDDDEAPFVADVIADRERAAFGLLTDQEVATAAFIVTACNSHQRLVDALQAIHTRSNPENGNDDLAAALFDCHCLAANLLAGLEGGAP